MSSRLRLPAGPRLLLFGRPGAGKSTLLAGLLQVAAKPSPVLKGRLEDETGKLAELASAPEPTGDEIIAYPVRYEPAEPARGTWSATLIDCSGAAAQEYIVAKQSLEARQPLATALLATDTLILVVDASSEGSERAQDFTQFAAFLRQLRQTRGKRADVAGLPVYLVLAKCDLLARPDDTQNLWVQRLEEGKRRVAARFQDFIARAGGSAVFGDLDLHVWATAARRPALRDRPARDEPYGVAELFRQALDSARAFEQRRDRAGQRLSSTVAGIAVLVAAMAGSAALLVAFQPDRDLTPVEEQVAAILPGGTSGADRLRGASAYLESKLRALQNLQRQEGYERLPAAERADLDRYGRELAAYLEAYGEARTKIKPPSLSKNAAELARYEKNLDSFTLPPEYAEAWKDTRLDKRLQEVRAEYAALHEAEAAEVAWMRQQERATRKLREQGNEFNAQMDAGKAPTAQALDEWFSAVDAQLEPHHRVPRVDPIPGVPGLTYERIDQLPAVQSARADWSSAQAVLRALADELRRRVRKMPG